MSSFNEDLRQQLRRAVIELNSRGLYHSAKWAAEQLRGMPQTRSTEYIPKSHRVDIEAGEIDVIQFSQSLMAMGEYQRCAHLYRSPMGLKPHLSSLSVFIACYSLYMAGEKLKDQADSENTQSLSNSFNTPMESHDVSNKSNKSANLSRNPYLLEIFTDLLPLYEDFHSDLFLEPVSSSKMDGFLLYLFAIVVRDLRSKDVNYHIPDHQKLINLPSTDQIFIQAISEYPYNW